MKMAKHRTCDMCGKEITTVVAKVFVSPQQGDIPKAAGRGMGHNYYTAHADIGPCCLPRLTKTFTWTNRRLRGK